MYRVHKIILGLIFLVVVFEARSLELELQAQMKSNIISLLGIVFGFTITAITAMSGTDFLKAQALRVDAKMVGVQKTNVQRLKEYFEFSCTIELFSILIIVLSDVVTNEWIVANVIYPFAYGLLFLSLCTSYFVLKLVLKYFLESVHSSIATTDLKEKERKYEQGH